MFKPDITDNVDFLAQIFLLHIVNGSQSCCVNSLKWRLNIEILSQHALYHFWRARGIIGHKKIGNLALLQLMHKSFASRNSTLSLINRPI